MLQIIIFLWIAASGDWKNVLISFLDFIVWKKRYKRGVHNKKLLQSARQFPKERELPLILLCMKQDKRMSK